MWKARRRRGFPAALAVALDGSRWPPSARRRRRPTLGLLARDGARARAIRATRDRSARRTGGRCPRDVGVRIDHPLDRLRDDDARPAEALRRSSSTRCCATVNDRRSRGLSALGRGHGSGARPARRARRARAAGARVVRAHVGAAARQVRAGRRHAPRASLGGAARTLSGVLRPAAARLPAGYRRPGLSASPVVSPSEDACILADGVRRAAPPGNDQVALACTATSNDGGAAQRKRRYCDGKGDNARLLPGRRARSGTTTAATGRARPRRAAARAASPRFRSRGRRRRLSKSSTRSPTARSGAAGHGGQAAERGGLAAGSSRLQDATSSLRSIGTLIERERSSSRARRRRRRYGAAPLVSNQPKNRRSSSGGRKARTRAETSSTSTRRRSSARERNGRRAWHKSRSARGGEGRSRSRSEARTRSTSARSSRQLRGRSRPGARAWRSGAATVEHVAARRTSAEEGGSTPRPTAITLSRRPRPPPSGSGWRARARSLRPDVRPADRRPEASASPIRTAVRRGSF